MARPKKDAARALRMFRDIPKLIKRKGRVAGFEELRNRALEEWEVLSTRMNPYSALKFAIEADRHAMFAKVAAERDKGTFDRELWENFQDYLHGAPMNAPGEERLPGEAPGPESDTSGWAYSEPTDENEGDESGDEEAQRVSPGPE